jgi:hypothetical protein
MLSDVGIFDTCQRVVESVFDFAYIIALACHLRFSIRVQQPQYINACILSETGAMRGKTR